MRFSVQLCSQAIEKKQEIMETSLHRMGREVDYRQSGEEEGAGAEEGDIEHHALAI